MTLRSQTILIALILNLILGNFNTLIAKETKTTPAERILLVLSSDLQAFYEFYRGFVEESRRLKIRQKIKTLILSETPFIEAEIERFKPSLIIAVGPQAARQLRNKIRDSSLVAALVPSLEPGECGVLLHPPPAKEEYVLKQVMSQFFEKEKTCVILPCKQKCEEARKIAEYLRSEFRVDIKPFKNFSLDTEALFDSPCQIIYLRPEPTLLVPPVAEFLIKKALYHHKVLFGCAYFCRNGAALCLKHDFRKAGELAAHASFRPGERDCRIYVPTELEINPKALRRVLE